MDTILQFVQQRKSLMLLIGAVLGLILGLIVGWGLWPVRWTNATPKHLRSDFQNEYLLYVAEQYSSAGSHADDLAWAREKLGAEFWEEGELAGALESLAAEQTGEETIRLRALATALERLPEGETAPATEPEEAGTGGGVLGSLGKVCGVGLLVIACVGAIVFLLNRLGRSRAESRAAERDLVGERVPFEEVSWGVEGPPLAQYVTTYTIGDDHYDPSFSIELDTGEFMGECGVGISETIGVGTPSKVAAFEVWLFDKNDIRTVTKVLMSDYAFRDEALRAKLAPKGEPVLAEVGKDVVLETKTLQVRARVEEAACGSDGMPADSFFEKLTVNLAVWEVAGPGGAQSTSGVDAPSMPPTL
jgi:hypothetical protein